MPARKLWESPKSGPDWTDVGVFLREIERVHTGTCYIALSPVGGLRGSEWEVIVLCELPVLSKNLDQIVAGTRGTWPNRDHATLEGFVYSLLVKLDWELAQNHYGQEIF